MQWSLIWRFTPVACPKSSGLCKALVESVEHSYVRVSPMLDAAFIFDRIAERFEDCSHSRLKMRFSGEVGRAL